MASPRAIVQPVTIEQFIESGGEEAFIHGSTPQEIMDNLSVDHENVDVTPLFVSGYFGGDGLHIIGTLGIFFVEVW